MKGIVKSLSLGLATVLLASSFVTGCAKNEEPRTGNKPGGEKVTISFWHTFNQEETQTINEIVKEFEAQNPDIKVDMQAVPFADAQNKFKVAAQAGNAPDVFRAEIAWTPEFAALGYLAPIDDLIKPEDKADYLEAPFNYNVYNGKIWGVPQVTDALALLYNKRMLKEAGVEPPKTMDELVKVAQKLTDKQKGRYGFFYRGDAYWYQPFMWAFGGGLIDSKDKTILVNTPGAVKGLQFMIDLRDKYGVVPKEIDFANDYDNMQVGFKTGKYAMILNGPWATSDLLSGPEFKDPDNLGIAPIPVGPEGKTGSPVGGHNYVISANTKNREAAYKFIEFINSREAQAKFAVKNNLLPTRKSAYELPEVKNNRIVSDFKAVIEKATNRPVIPEGGQIYTDFTPNYQAALKGQKTPQQALDDVAAAWKKLLNK
ncbi:MAG: extracellular solute-binding protein [Bacillota bacterium]|uniref:Arabinogalactan oligomer / maltooligosaccharide transport system substrate-binding protein n=2 Tax=Carboxydocella TaxID=178898 RepID=A0A1T4R962_9FIRM|nr:MULTISPECIES: extracellular solute-binding protein [Carboxydocella]AVX19728.1 carbohydrate ABC transporter substrate-binding protein, CUT1 family [Carboxydocella thermautotrophica]AVX30139.1 carbohydrate ABC transporter substrate-binding protein, CUT1 family [Carboxydocella thermautotrophica]SKA12208.1 arabinogalactan oligomer / maltooligosaccharide transport system substrate-binding protein [Carboxydocella sporoproducens DSM 16521]GAW29790.1 hypothetical protein ULO1_23600 [Carboxydocella s